MTILYIDRNKWMTFIKSHGGVYSYLGSDDRPAAWVTERDILLHNHGAKWVGGRSGGWILSFDDEEAAIIFKLKFL